MFPLLSTASSILFRRLSFFFFFCFAVASQNLLYTSYKMISHLNHLESRIKCEPIDGFGVGRSTLYRRQICKSKVHRDIVDICVKRERPFSALDSSTRRRSIYWWIERVGATLNELNALGSTPIARTQANGATDVIQWKSVVSSRLWLPVHISGRPIHTRSAQP